MESVSYAQNGEDLFVLEYFGDFKGELLDIGANDGMTFSNSRLLIEIGWDAHLLEPGSIFDELYDNYKTKPLTVAVHNFGIGEKSEVVQFYESGPHIKNGKDKGLVSTTDYQETLRWTDVEFIEKNIQLVTFENFYDFVERPKFDFISLDAEGMDWQILQQIDLDAVGCKVLCIEWNSKPELLKLFTDYCKGFRIGLMNAENLVFVR